MVINFNELKQKKNAFFNGQTSDANLGNGINFTKLKQEKAKLQAQQQGNPNFNLLDVNNEEYLKNLQNRTNLLNQQKNLQNLILGGDEEQNYSRLSAEQKAQFSRNVQGFVKNKAETKDLQREIDRVGQIQKYKNKTYEDTFTGQTAANYAVNKIGQDSALAWNTYLNDPTEKNRQYALTLDQLNNHLQMNNAAALDDENAKLSWVSKSLAGYLPQLTGQMKAGATGAIAGGTLGSLALPGAGTAMGVKAGIVAGSGAYSFNTMRGAAFRNLLEMGVDEETARKIAKDEAVISSIIEMADTGINIATLGIGSLIKQIGKNGLKTTAKILAKEETKNQAESALRKFGKGLARYGINIGAEGAQEGLQEIVSIANERRISDDTTDSGVLGLAGDLWGTARNLTYEDKNRVWENTKEGAKIAAMVGGGTILGTNIANRVLNGGNRNIRYEVSKYNDATPQVMNQLTGLPVSSEANAVLTKLNNDEAVPSEIIDAIPEIREARERIGDARPTSEIHTPERNDLRQNILRRVLDMGSAKIDNNGKVAYNGTVRQDRRADIVIGLPAAGKSSVLADPLSQQHQSRIIDSDMVKEMLPEFDNGYGAGRVHEESKGIANEWFDTSVLNGDNIVYPIVGSDLVKVIEHIDRLKANGYSVYLHLNELSNHKATGRAIRRFFETGRFVDPALVMEYGNRPSQVYNAIRQLEGYIDGYSRYSNDVPYGQQPRLIERSEDLSDHQGDVRRRPGMGISSEGVSNTQDFGGLRRPDRRRTREDAVGRNTQTEEDTGSTETAGAGTETTEQKIAGDEPAFSMGNKNADSAEALIEKYGAIPPGENASRNIMIPQETGQGHVRRFYRTAAEAKGTPDDMVDNIIDQSLQDSYIPIADKKAQEYADRTIAHYGHNGALEKWNSVVNGERHATKEELALGEKLYLDAANAGDTKTAMKLLAEVAAEGTRAGQVVQAIRMIKKMTPAGQLYYVSKVVDGVNKDLAKRIKKGKAKYVKVNEHLANKLLKAQNQEQIDAAVMDIYADIGKQMPNTWVDKWNAWRYLSMLGNPRTHIRNIIGNGIFYPVRRLSNAIAAGMEKTVTLLPMAKDMERTRSVLVKGKKSDEALKSWAAKDYEENKAAIFAGGKYNPSDIIRDNQEIFRIRLLEKARKLNTSLLDKEDMWVSRPTYIKTLAGYLKANGLTPDTATPQQLEKARTFAIQESQKASFRETNAFANWLSRSSRQGKAQALLIEGILPFKKTPLNILKQGTVEYSPVGLVKSMYDAAINIRNGNKTAAEVIGEFSKGLTGTGLVALGAYLTAQGLLNGLGDDDEKQAQLDKLKGLQNYSLQIGDMSYTIDWAAPGILPLFVGAELYHYMHNNDERVTFPALLDGMSRITEPMIENSMLSGLNSTLKAGAYEDDILTATVGSVLMNYLGQSVPTLFGQIARTIDPVRRNTYDVNKNSVLPTAVQKFGEKQMAKLPGLSMMLEPSIDEWGREKTYAENIGLRAVENFLSPGYISMKKEDKATMETERLYQKTGDSSVLPTFAPKYFTFNNKRIDLSGKQYTEFAKKKGQTAYQTINSIMQDSRYKKLSDSKKAEVIADAQYYATVSAKRSIEPSYGDETWVQKAMEAKKAGILPKTYIFIKNAVDQDGSGRPSKKEAINILSKNYGLSKKQKAVMFHLLCPTVKENPFS